MSRRGASGDAASRRVASVTGAAPDMPSFPQSPGLFPATHHLPDRALADKRKPPICARAYLTPEGTRLIREKRSARDDLCRTRPARSSPATNEPPPGLAERLLANAARLHAKAGRTLISQDESLDQRLSCPRGHAAGHAFFDRRPRDHPSQHCRRRIVRRARGDRSAGRARRRSSLCPIACWRASPPSPSAPPINEVPGAWLWLARRLSGQVRDLTGRLLERSALKVKSRLHCELLRRCREASADEDEVTLEPSPTHAQLAACIGTHREAVTREMRYLAGRGILRAAASPHRDQRRPRAGEAGPGGGRRAQLRLDATG